MKIRDAVVLVTGASRGIGRGYAGEFLAAGAKKVYLGVRNPGSVADLAGKDPARMVPLQLDVTKAEDIRKAAQAAKDVTILVSNAGVLHGGGLLDGDRMENARHEMEVNYFGPLAMIRAFAPVLEANGGGAIVSVSSIAGLVAFPGIPTYCTSKAAVYFLAQAARMELGPRGIFVLSVHPGPVDTDMTRDFDMEKVTLGHVARETIRALEAGEEMLLPDPYAQEIYALWRKDPALAARKVGESFGHPA